MLPSPRSPHPIEQIQSPNGQTIYVTGPPLSQGPLPAVFYFCSTGMETLGTAPYSQPVAFLRPYPVRIFSMSLPLHDDARDRRKAVSLWAAELSGGNDPLTPFLEHTCANIDYLVREGFISPKQIVTAGLSRGGWVASHLAAKCTHVKAVAAFAPLIDLPALPDFRRISHIEYLSLFSVMRQLIGMPLRYYIGNHDTRVGTDICIRFIQSLIEASHHANMRTVPVELIISPSIGHQGHGTPPSVFRSGAQWLAATLGILSQDEGYYP